MLTAYEKIALLAYARKVIKYSFFPNMNKNNLLPIYSAVYQVHLGNICDFENKTGKVKGLYWNDRCT